MQMLHPASQLLTWVIFALALQCLPLAGVLLATLLVLILALIFARHRSQRLFRRSKWLLLSLGVLFLFATPGEYLPGAWGQLGMTHEGVDLGLEHLGRLSAMLASLALLHELLGTSGFLAACYWWLGPLPWRRATVVRLMLVLEFAEKKQQPGWRAWLVSSADPSDVIEANYFLAMSPLHLRDTIWMVGLMVLGVFAIFAV
jgi:hypothetical protein